MTRTSRGLVFGVLLGLGVFAGFSIYADTGKLGERLAGYAWWTFAGALGLALINYILRFARWQLYLRARDIEVSRDLSATIFVSGFALSVTPGKVGELLKSYLLRATRGIAVTRSAPIVVAERVTDLIALLLLGLAGVALYGAARTTVLVGAGVVAAGLVVLTLPGLSRGIIDLITRPRFLRKLRDRLHLFYNGLAELVRPRPLSWATAIAVLAWLAECLGFALIASGFPGAGVPIGLAILIYASTTIAGALSFLPGGLLVTEAAMTLFLVETAVGFDEPTAVAATILTRLATLWFAVVLGMGALLRLRLRHGEVSEVLDGDDRRLDPPGLATPSGRVDRRLDGIRSEEE
jgi:uncharacterized protein (TIRG00374 family)